MGFTGIRLLVCQSLTHFAVLYSIIVCLSTQASDKPSISDGHCKYFLSQMASSRDLLEKSILELTSSKAFTAYLKARGIHWETATNREAIVNEYLREKFKPLLSLTPELAEAQDKELNHQLDLRGAPAFGYGRARLNHMSSRNLDRLLGIKSEEELARLKGEFPEIWSKMKSLRIDFPHNSLRIQQRNQNDRNATPLLSSRQILALGYPQSSAGLNTNLFNKEILQSDNEVFFNVRFAGEGPPGYKRNTDNRYGPEVAVANSSFVRERGWVSAYVMNEWDVAKALRGDVAHVSELDRLRYSGDKQWPTISAAMPQLHKYDFTVADFELLIQLRLFRVLSEAKTSDPAKYLIILSTIENGFDHQVKQMLDKEVFGPLHLPSEFEMKIPVAAPVDTIDLRR